MKRFGPTARLLSPREYVALQAVFSAYAIAWLATLAYIANAPRISTVLKGVTLVVLVVVTPALSDLFETYSDYKSQWRNGNTGHHSAERQSPRIDV